MTLVPFLRVLTFGTWFSGSVAAAVTLLGVGVLLRHTRLARPVIPLLQGLVLAIGLTTIFGTQTNAFGALIGTSELDTIPVLLQLAIAQVVDGVAPLTPNPALSIVIVAALGLLTIMIDALVLIARVPLFAGVGLFAVWMIPAIAVPDAVDILAFAGFAVALLLMFRAVTTLQFAVERRHETDSNRQTSAASATMAITATGIGAAAIVIALVVTPNIPQGPSIPGLGAGGAPVASLNLGNTLRQPTPTEVLTHFGTARQSPYLRVATLSSFTGAVWLPDEPSTVPLADDQTYLGQTVAARIPVDPEVTTIRVTNLNRGWAPLPYPVDAVTGLDGPWLIAPSTGTVVSEGAVATGQEYTVTARVPNPSREQLQATSVDRSLQEYRELPEGLPAVIADLAAAQTAETSSDYDALIALQNWFRGPEFSYSLDAPVQQGFDGTGSEAVASFLQARAGYCIHFAAAFALMARTLEMPSRIVVGYRPGEQTGRTVDDQPEYQVTSAQLHSWPEVYFSGVGWVSFEPTKSLGRATSYASDSATPAPTPTSSASTPTATPSASSSAGPDRPDESATEDASSSTTSRAIFRTFGIPLAILLVLLAPMLISVVRRSARHRSARAGDAVAAWTLVQETTIDLGISLPTGDSPRALGARLVAEFGAPEPEMTALVTAIELTSYGPGGAGGTGNLSPAARTVQRALIRASTMGTRARSVFLPRSLVIRPGAAYAARGR